MLLCEIFPSGERVLTATERFRETFNAFKKAYPSINGTLKEFVAFRLAHGPDEPYASKDKAFSTNNDLRGFRHFHMVYGKVILIYRITADELRLCLVTDHSYDKPVAVQRLITALHNNTKFNPLSLDEQPKLSATQISDITQLLYEFAAEDRQGLMHALSGHLSDLLEFTRLLIDDPWSNEQKDQATFAAFGGADGLIQFGQKILSQTAQSG